MGAGQRGLDTSRTNTRPPSRCDQLEMVDRRGSGVACEEGSNCRAQVVMLPRHPSPHFAERLIARLKTVTNTTNSFDDP